MFDFAQFKIDFDLEVILGQFRPLGLNLGEFMEIFATQKGYKIQKFKRIFGIKSVNNL